MRTHRRVLRYTKYGLRTRQIKMIHQRKTRRNAPYKWFKLPRGHNSGTLPESAHVSIHTYYTLFLNKYFTCFTTFHLCGNSFLQSQRARALVTDTGLMARIWCFHHSDPASTSGWSPTPSCCRPRLPKIISTTNWKYSEKNQEVPKSKTWICSALATIYVAFNVTYTITYIAFTLYIQLLM